MKSLTSLNNYRVMLAPLRFGAGIKGKITDSWYYHLPVVTTPIGAEGLFKQTVDNNIEYKSINLNSRFYSDHESEVLKKEEPLHKGLNNYYQYNPDFLSYANEIEFGGLFNNLIAADEFAQSAIRLYTDQDLWENCLKVGSETVENRLSFLMNEALLMRHITKAQLGLKEFRKNNHIQSLVWSETLRAHDKLSKYLMEKNKNSS